MEHSDPLKKSSTKHATESMKERWNELAAAIASDVQSGARYGKKVQGTLSVLGSGIMHPDIIIDTEQRIINSDYIFYSVNDYVTKGWINHLRPDSYDLSILYSESIDRHDTYTRMAEALLYHVRRGRRVVAIFYGHPGIFAAPGHRAIQVARQEGHQARMRPGISALDCLIADIGFDPALPGMVTYEATDMLLHRRRVDPTLHVVIWQVGVVGEFGYNRQGYGNRGLEALTDALAAAYGPDWAITHYIGAQYVGIEPRIERLTVGSLREPDTARKLNTLSTFYIPPKEVLDIDGDMALALGIAVDTKPMTQKVGYTGYGPGEWSTLRAMESLPISEDYRVVEPSNALAFLLKLSQDVGLREHFESDPRSILASPMAADLTGWEKSLMMTRSQKATVAALTNVPAPATFDPSGPDASSTEPAGKSPN